MIHYHGTPLTPRSEMIKMAGKHFCVSFARPDDGDWCLANGQSVMWDNGAFSFYRRGEGSINVPAYQKWLEPRLGHPHWCVVPDVIGGDELEQRALVAAWTLPKELSAPVWHMGLPIKWLLELSENWPRLCFGSSAAYWQVGSEAWERRCDEAFNAMEKRGLRPWVHMLRGLALAGDRWPFASADSVNVARNFCGNVCPERMARRIDAIQCPTKWTVKPTQTNFLDDFSSI